MNRGITIILVVAAFVVGIAVGQFAAGRNVVTYAVPVPHGEVRNAVHMDWPTYGLPMTEYRMFLMILDNGDTNALRRRLDTCLDMALFDASFRRLALPGAKRDEIDKTIAFISDYRSIHPRSTDMPKRDEVTEQWWKSGYPYWSNQYSTVDSLLEEVKKVPPGRVGGRSEPPAPHQTVRAIFPHTAFRCSSS